MSDLERLFNKGTSIAHCPLSNMYFSAKPFPLREALDQHVKVGLGTDVAGGYSLDIMNAMRQAVAVSRIREGERVLKGGPQSQNLSVDWKESLFLATRGGSVALGLEGMFKVGVPFDAQESKCLNKIIEDNFDMFRAVRLFDPMIGSSFGSLEYFESDDGMEYLKLTPEIIEKWWCIGDTRNRGRLWVQGRQVKDA